jgi:hypothetical protein
MSEIRSDSNGLRFIGNADGEIDLIGSASRINLKAAVRSNYQGLLATWVSTTSFSIASGTIADSTFAATMVLAATMTKTTSAWSAGTGNGGLDTGAIANTTLYAVYLIANPTTGGVDVTYSTNATTPTLQSGWTLYKRVNWVWTNGSGQFLKWFQSGRQVWLDSKSADLSAITPASTNRILATVKAPPGTEGMFVINATTVTNSFWYDSGWTVITDAAASATNSIARFPNTAGSHSYRAIVDASRQIYYRVDAVTSNVISLLTQGWIDELI